MHELQGSVTSPASTLGCHLGIEAEREELEIDFHRVFPERVMRMGLEHLFIFSLSPRPVVKGYAPLRHFFLRIATTEAKRKEREK